MNASYRRRAGISSGHAKFERCLDLRTITRYCASAMLFDLSDETMLLQSTVREFAQDEVAPVAEHLDRTKSFPYELVKQMGELGWMGIPFPEAVGGAGRACPRRGPHQRGVEGAHHAVPAPLARNPADLPVRVRRAERALLARPVRRPQ